MYIIELQLKETTLFFKYTVSMYFNSFENITTIRGILSCIYLSINITVNYYIILKVIFCISKLWLLLIKQ